MFAFAQKKGMVYKNYQIFVQEVYKRASLHLLMRFLPINHLANNKTYQTPKRLLYMFTNDFTYKISF